MPLVDPVTMNTGSGTNNDWMTKLMGKKIHEVKNDLPKNHRVIEGDSMSTMDFNPDRLNVHVDKEGIVKNVKHG